jgi:prophage antirepressor-like protein
MDSIMPYTFPDTQQLVRTAAGPDGEPWFVAADVAAVLDLGNAHSSLALLDDDERGLHTVDTPGGAQQMTTVSEAGLYAMIIRSRKPQARAFRRWITHEVIPSIRRTGAYSLPAPDPASPAELTRMDILRMAIDSEEGRLLAEARVAELEPAAAAWDQLASADQDFSVREAALILQRDPHIDTGERRLFGVLRGMGLVDRQDRPYQRHAQHVRLRPRSYTDRASGVEMPGRPQVRVTVAGLQYLHRRLGGAVSIHRHVAEHQLQTAADDALFALPR